MHKILFLCFCYFSITFGDLPPSCPSEIYCYGELLNDVQLAKLYPDSKTFVDFKLKDSPKNVISSYKQLKKERGTKLSQSDIKGFVQQYFSPGDELEDWTPPDWSAAPSLANKVVDPSIRNWTLSLNDIWKSLSRKIKDDVKNNPDLYSLIYVPNGFVIPGGRFRELYYWDTYWIIKGLMLCDMHQTAKGMIENLLHLVEVLGHVPNGNRVYYWKRSQPPFLTMMVDHYVSVSGDHDFIKTAYPILMKELEWWISNRSIIVKFKGNNYFVFRYHAPSDGPRPESYSEDVETVAKCPDNGCKTSLYISLKSGAESGWDFSSRWFIKNATNDGDLSNIDTGDIAPVDLNAFMHKNIMIMKKYSLLLGLNDTQKLSALADELQMSLNEVFYNPDEGVWFDYDVKNAKARNYFYMSNFAPLWTKSYSDDDRTMIAQGVVKYIKSVGLDTKFPGGSPTSLMPTGQQWDLPNAWAPLQSILVYGLNNLATPQTTRLAYKLARTWVLSNHQAFLNTSYMFEKYNSNKFGSAGGGGEYEVQSGFGWSNGAVLEMLNTWPHISPANKL